jgi:hypothetical protein
MKTKTTPALRPLDLIAIDDVQLDVMAISPRSAPRRVAARFEIDTTTRRIVAMRLTPAPRRR